MFIGLDLGTSGVKAIVINEAQEVLAEANASLTVSRPKTGWSEQEPLEWIAATSQAMEALGAKVDLSGVQAIGLSGQMHGATVLDETDTPLRPCILWNDTRSAMEAAQMDAEPEWRAISGNIVFPGFTAPKLAWMRNHEAEVFDKIATVLLPKDYLRLWFTGEKIAEMSDAAGTSWLDTGARDWSDALLEKTGLSRSQMPRLVEGSQAAGTLRDTLAADWGLTKGVVVAGGGGDNAASAIGMGVTEPGQSFVSLGTSGVLFAATGGYAPGPETAVHTFCHALPGMWHQMGVILSATDALNWYAGLVGADAAALTGGLGRLQAPGRTLFLPYLGGERTPLNSASIRGNFLHLDHTTDQAAGTRAVLEGVAFALADCKDALTETGTTFETCMAVGGGTRSDYWLETVATALNLPLSLPVAGDFGAAFGAARLGMMAIDGDTSCATPPPIERVIAPNKHLVDAFAESHARYKTAAQTMLELS